MQTLFLYNNFKLLAWVKCEFFTKIGLKTWLIIIVFKKIIFFSLKNVKNCKNFEKESKMIRFLHY